MWPMFISGVMLVIAVSVIRLSTLTRLGRVWFRLCSMWPVRISARNIMFVVYKRFSALLLLVWPGPIMVSVGGSALLFRRRLSMTMLVWLAVVVSVLRSRAL